MKVINTLPQVIKQTIFFSVLAMLVLVQGCSKNKTPTPDADATGYYNVGSLSVDGGATTDNALQAMISGDRIMMMSFSHGLLYDGTMTISGNDFTATVKVYTNGKDPITATMAGTITEGSQITGGTLTGAGVGNGTFSLTYADSNNQFADVTRIDNIFWSYPIYSADPDSRLIFEISTPSSLIHNDVPYAGDFETCAIVAGATINPINNSALYTVNLDLETCVILDQAKSVNTGSYSGFAVSKTVADTTLVVAFSNGSFAIIGEFTKL